MFLQYGPRPYVSIVLLAYNEEESLPGVFKDLDEHVPSSVGEYGVEYILVNDCSSDDTGKIMDEWAMAQKGREEVKVVHHKLRSGPGAAAMTGVMFASGDYVLTMDGDGQHRGVDVKKIIDELRDNPGRYDYIIGCRGKGTPVNWMRLPGKKCLYFAVQSVINGKIQDYNSGLRAIRRDIFLGWIHLLSKGYGVPTSTTILAVRSGLEGKEVPIIAPRRAGGKSRVCQARDGLRTLWLILKMKMATPV